MMSISLLFFSPRYCQFLPPPVSLLMHARFSLPFPAPALSLPCHLLSRAFITPQVFDPAVDWMPDAERMALLSAAKGDALLPPTLMLYSSEWRDKGWGYYHHMSMTFGGKDGASQRPHPRHHVATLPLSTHVTFCDAVFMVPLWIGRTLGHVDRKGDPYFLFAAQDTMLSTWLSHFHR